MLPLLAAAVAPNGTVLGVDYSLPHVERARQLAHAHGLQEIVTIEVADLRAELPVAPHSCDAIWIADVLYPDTVGEPVVTVARLARLLKSGGVLAVFYGNWLRPIYLPGYARLEHLISAAREARYARERTWQGQFHPERALAWLRAAGLEACRLHVFPVVYSQPLPQPVREYITTAILAGHYAGAVAALGLAAELSPEDEVLWQQLSDPMSPDFILDQPDYYCVASPLLALGRRTAE